MGRERDTTAGYEVSQGEHQRITQGFAAQALGPLDDGATLVACCSTSLFVFDLSRMPRWHLTWVFQTTVASPMVTPLPGGRLVVAGAEPETAPYREPKKLTLAETLAAYAPRRGRIQVYDVSSGPTRAPSCIAEVATTRAVACPPLRLVGKRLVTEVATAHDDGALVVWRIVGAHRHALRRALALARAGRATPAAAGGIPALRNAALRLGFSHATRAWWGGLLSYL